jgi:branched-chain amino acid transport system substrate-binding protein
MKRTSIIPGLMAVIFCWCMSTGFLCDKLETNARKRIEYTMKNKGDIVIGVVWPTSVRKGFFMKGIELALEEINDAGLMGRKIELVIRDDANNKDKALTIAREFSNNNSMIAVIGHSASGITMPASFIYQYSGLLFINTASTNSTLTRHKLDLFFRIIPDNQTFAKKVAEYTYLMGYRKPIVVYVRGYYGKDLSNNYQAYLGDMGIPIVHKFSYFPGARDWRSIFRKFKNLDYDVVFLAGSVPEAAHLINQSRAWGVTVPFIGSDGFDTNLLLNIGKASVEGSMYCGVFNPESQNPFTRNFVQKFLQKFNYLPDTEAAQAYDALKLVAFMIHKSQSTNPYVLASNLMFLENWEGVTGKHNFSESGDVINKTIYFKKIQNQQPSIVTFAEEQLTLVEQMNGGSNEASKTGEQRAANTSNSGE